VDLVFEPRLGPPSLARAAAIATPTAGAIGVALDGRDGRRTSIYWSPYSRATDEATFEDGTRLTGPLAVITPDGEALSTGCTFLEHAGVALRFGEAVQQGRIVGLDRTEQTIDVKGVRGVVPGDRVWINPEGRAHTYAVERVEGMSDGTQRLTLDVTSVLGRGRLLEVTKEGVVIGVASDPTKPYRLHMLDRTGNLHGTRLVSNDRSAWAEVTRASHAGSDRTRMTLGDGVGDPDAIRQMGQGAWVSVADYVVGDAVRYEPLCSARIRLQDNA
jgi:hypothetical protein